MALVINRKIVGLMAIGLGLVGVAIFLIFFKSKDSPPAEIETDFFPAGESREIPTAENNRWWPIIPSRSELTQDSTQEPAVGATTTDDSSSEQLLVGSRFKNLVPEPVAGATILSTTTETIFYFDQATGNLYRLTTTDGEVSRLSYTTLTGLRKTILGGQADQPVAIIKQENGLEIKFQTVILTASSSAATVGELTSSNLPVDYYEFIANPAGNKIFSLKREGNDFFGVLTDFNFTKPEKIIKLFFGDWWLAWPNINLIVLTTKPSASVPGSLYFLDLKTKKFEKILSEINGLVGLVSPTGRFIFYSGLEGDKPITRLYDREKRVTISIPFTTFALKCVWTKDSLMVYCAVPTTLPKNRYPEIWLKGLVNLTDDFWQFDLINGNAKIVAATGQDNIFDARDLFIDNAAETIFFINKKDSSLWSFDIRESF